MEHLQRRASGARSLASQLDGGGGGGSCLLFQCRPFEHLEACVRGASRLPEGSSAATCEQVNYLASYLSHPEIDAKTILVEAPYVDRHWLEEYSHYYATLLQPPPVKATRLHFFDEAWTLEDVMQLLAERIDRPADRTIDEHYLGFSVIRPLPAAPIGRTILRPYSKEKVRCFAAASLRNRVHLGGLTLEVEGLPFQQQDQGVAACATTAIWSALAKTLRGDGGRAPTPFAVTKAATDHQVQARSFPATAGLDLDQMATAIHAFGYQPHVFRPPRQSDEFSLALKTYLRSGIPVVMRAKAKDADLHALTLVGFREWTDKDEPALQALEIAGKVSIRSKGVVRWYAHDDRLGPYARLGLAEGGATLQLMPSSAGFAGLTAPMTLYDAIVPLYPKLRLTAEELIQFSLDLAPLVKRLMGNSGASEEDLLVEPRFMLGGEYLHSLHSLPMETRRKVDICTKLVMSRYVGVLSWFLGGEWILDAVYDTTDLRRGDASRPPILALLPRNPLWIQALEMVRRVRLGDGPLIT